MATTPKDLLNDLKRYDVSYDLIEHIPVVTVAEMMRVLDHVPGVNTKNFFLRDAKKTYFLVSVAHDAKVDLKALRRLVGARGNLSFASAEALSEKLAVAQGAVSPLAIVNDELNEVQVFLEKKLLQAERVNVHVLANTLTVSIPPADLDRYLTARRHSPRSFSFEEADKSA